MRQVLSISLQGNTINTIKKRVKSGGFNSISEYFKYLFKMDTDDIILEEELMEDIKQARRDYKNGELKILKSLKDLM